ncbi:hypothetical protein QE152_g11127 [Popillia japonica]|uniref:Uncharacterized protein n=1 Tax=Popillia japonica TaxID=7064 RepID=A0AAW1LTB3_POPJA
MKELAKRGHEITFFSPFPETEPVKNFKTIVLTGLVEEWNQMFFLSSMTSKIMEQTLAHENLHGLLRSGEKFDIVLVDRFVYDLWSKR